MDSSGFRLDLQGVRGFALILVLGCHAGLPFLHGGFVGLDAFFVLSGFLITGLILAEVGRTGTISLTRFYARRARRLLPLAATVLIFTFAGSLLLFGSVRAYETGGDISAAALYFVNWRFISQQIDYFEFEGPTVSPVQHFWSLSVEEQFYLAWPLMVLALLFLARRAGLSPRLIIWLAISSLGLASLAYGIWFSPHDPQSAYFSTLTRIWQIGLGCALAVVLPRALSLSQLVSSVVAGAGLLALALTAWLYTSELAYPGWYALIPTVGTAAIIVAGTATVASAPLRFLSLPPFQYLGRISYAWYLWHWPILAFAAAMFGELSVAENVLATCLAWIPTVVTHHLIEERFRRSSSLASRPRRALALGASCTAGAAALGLALVAAQPVVPTSGEVAGAGEALEGKREIQKEAKAIRPNPREAKKDREPPAQDGCHLRNTPETDPPACVYGDPSSSTTLVNVGDSHGLMYSPALIRLGERRGWRVVNLTRDTCVVADVKFKPDCDEWREKAMQRIERERPSVITVSAATDDGERYAIERDGRRLSRDESEPDLEAGLKRTLVRLRATGARVVVIRDISKAPIDVVDCVGDNSRRLDRCVFPFARSEKRAYDARAARETRGVELIDPQPLLCAELKCPAVIGDALVYRNATHLTATFSSTLADWFDEQL